MDIEQLISPERVRCVSEAKDKEQVLSYVGQLIGEAEDRLTGDEICKRLMARERLGSTGLGHGVALPHARLEGIDKAIGAFIRLDQGIDFHAFDRAPVDILFALVVPEHFTDEHLQILAALAEMFSDPELCEKLRSPSSDDSLHEILRGWRPSSDST
ncbi:PTS sugar transporter subunit IIA [Halorhodospira halochloris]|uniref:PTS IIA-like nitrogen-regulatory protein PtsN n=1 Tax=Halorhodospira halochloris TaxID=1052 RepID=A0A0X8XAX6_HALHR|nr:PTS sugar transporter subunit IIA [Halorhodospira halochloris]MBK1651685.1 PTS sugar transporter subunit IIA [Halorhodospira halochloris]MCG5529607.1 PTS sugar transporter subunit IIA [Halorhodospira halochloris]MCG5548114.1 PTS sugar transporter subunit IIA [Halorhodospira halochloris]BAU58549.1 PTS IIA-like nitrogen-regulatory protein PtsN [Halorhodospira halochloris]